MSGTVALRCGRCRYFNQTGVADEGREPSGECHRYAPQPFGTRDGSGDWRWPYLNGNDWCGEWAPKGEAALPQQIADIVRDNIHLCGHGFIGSTCGLCMREWVPR